jgi:hypothetical protein
MDALNVAAEDLLLRVTEDPLGRRIPVADATLQVHDDHCIRDRREHQRLSCEGSLRALLLADVLDLRDEVERRPGRVSHERDRKLDPDDVPLPMDVPLLHLVRPNLAGENTSHEREVRREVVGMGDCLKSRGEELTLIVADDLTERAIDAKPTAVGRHEGNADRGVLECSVDLRARPFLLPPLCLIAEGCRNGERQPEHHERDRAQERHRPDCRPLE